MHVASWLSAYSVMKLFYFPSVFVQGFPGLRQKFVFNYIPPTIMAMKMDVWQSLNRADQLKICGQTTLRWDSINYKKFPSSSLLFWNTSWMKHSPNSRFYSWISIDNVVSKMPLRLSYGWEIWTTRNVTHIGLSLKKLSFCRVFNEYMRIWSFSGIRTILLVWIN